MGLVSDRGARAVCIGVFVLQEAHTGPMLDGLCLWGVGVEIVPGIIKFLSFFSQEVKTGGGWALPASANIDVSCLPAVSREG